MNQRQRSQPFMTAEYAEPEHFIAHISDIHLIADGDNLYGSKSHPEKNLKVLFNKLERSGNRPEAIIFTGDLADMGELDAYKKILDIVNPAAERMNFKPIWVMGNHDSREYVTEMMLHETPSLLPVDRTYYIGEDLKIITLDTTLPGYHHGEIDAEQLNWLDNELNKDSDKTTLLALHHPPIPSVLKLATVVELRNQKALAEVIQGRNIQGIIGGHLHYSTHSMFAGIPVSVASATCYTQDLNVMKGGTRGRNGAQSYNLIHTYGKTIVHTTVPLSGGSDVGEFVEPLRVEESLRNCGY